MILSTESINKVRTRRKTDLDYGDAHIMNGKIIYISVIMCHLHKNLVLSPSEIPVLRGEQLSSLSKGERGVMLDCTAPYP